MGQWRASFAHERARLELPETSLKAWRTRLAASGLARAESLTPSDGRKIAGAARASARSRPGTAAARVSVRHVRTFRPRGISACRREDISATLRGRSQPAAVAR